MDVLKNPSRFDRANTFLEKLSGVTDTLLISILFVITCIPVFTIGASLTSLYYTMVKVIRHKRGKAVESYFACFKRNFRQSLWLTLIFLGYVLVGLGDIYAIGLLSQGGGGTLSVVRWLYLLPAAVMLPWVFPYLSRFADTNKTILKNSFRLAVRYLGTTALALLLFAVFGLSARFVPIVLPLLPAPLCLILSRRTEKVFRTLTEGREHIPGTDEWYNE